MIVVSDTSVIINLATIGEMGLLNQLFGQIIIPQAVFDEITVQGNGLPGSDEVRTATWIEVRQVANPAILNTILEADLDAGETEAIAIALELKADRILMDEMRGRELAVRLNLSPIGILGILLEAKRKGIIDQVRPYVDRLIDEAGFFVGQSLYNRILGLAGE